jgi:hypothetical protein
LQQLIEQRITGVRPDDGLSITKHCRNGLLACPTRE